MITRLLRVDWKLVCNISEEIMFQLDLVILIFLWKYLFSAKICRYDELYVDDSLNTQQERCVCLLSNNRNCALDLCLVSRRELGPGSSKL